MTRAHFISQEPQFRTPSQHATPRRSMALDELLNHQQPSQPCITDRRAGSRSPVSVAPIPTIRKHPERTPSLSPTRRTPIRGPWRPEEDRLLQQLVDKFGARQWTTIATHLPNRSGKQARERWINQLDPSLIKKNWTAMEDRTILQEYQARKSQWSVIAQLLPGRTDNAVKNRYNSALKRTIRSREDAGASVHIEDIVRSLHPIATCTSAHVHAAARHANRHGLGSMARETTTVARGARNDRWMHGREMRNGTPTTSSGTNESASSEEDMDYQMWRGNRYLQTRRAPRHELLQRVGDVRPSRSDGHTRLHGMGSARRDGGGWPYQRELMRFASR